MLACAFPDTVLDMILITGASGFIGRRLRRPEDRALVRGQIAGANEIAGDLLDPASLAVACRGVSTIYHCAGHAHSTDRGDGERHWRVNDEGTRNLLAAAGTAGVERFIFLSSVKAMADPGTQCVDEDWAGMPVTPYGQAKRAAEEAVLEAGARQGMHVVNLRLAMVYGRGGRGNLQRMANAIRAGWFPPLPETANRRSLVHVADVVAAVRAVAAAPRANGRTYIVAARQTYSGRALYDAIRAALGMPEARWRVPECGLRAVGRLGDGWAALTGRSLPIDSNLIARLLDSECYSPRRIEVELGWSACVGLDEGLRDMVCDEAPV